MGGATGAAAPAAVAAVAADGAAAAAAAAESAGPGGCGEGELFLLAFLAFFGGSFSEDSLAGISPSCCCCSSSPRSALRRLSWGVPSPPAESLWGWRVKLMGEEAETQEVRGCEEGDDEMLSGQSRLS